MAKLAGATPKSPADIDVITGLPLLTTAIADLSQFGKQLKAGELIGVASISIDPSAALYRLTPEATQRLRLLASQRLTAVLRPQDRLYSMSTWEWLVVFPALFSPAPLTLAMLRLNGALSEPIETLDGDTLILENHCGGSLWPHDGEDPLHLIQSARIAGLYAARSNSSIETYQPSLETPLNGSGQRFDNLAPALSGNGLFLPCLHLQPQIDLKTGGCTSAEALLRWPLNDFEFASPHHVIAALEKQGLRHTFTRWLFNQAMQIIKTLGSNGIVVPISVNLSANDLVDVELPDLLTQALETWDIAPERLLLEITETTAIEESRQVEEVLKALRKLGVPLAIDDFGTGYAGMSYLQRLPVKEVKIDQCFVRQAAYSQRDREIVASVTQLALRLNLRVVAEGVEDIATAELLTQLGCQHAQGHLYAKAMPVEDFIFWWKARRAALNK